MNYRELTETQVKEMLVKLTVTLESGDCASHYIWKYRFNPFDSYLFEQFMTPETEAKCADVLHSWFTLYGVPEFTPWWHNPAYQYDNSRNDIRRLNWLRALCEVLANGKT